MTIYFFIALAVSVLLTALVRWLATRAHIVDRPDGHRKRHAYPVPLLGGLAIFAAFWAIMAFLVFCTDEFGKNIHPERLVGVFIGGLLLMAVGFYDDWRGLSPRVRFLASVVAVLAVIIGGVGLEKITNPFGGVIRLDFWQVAIGHAGEISIVSALLVFFWLLGTMYTTKILDGLDGLSAGIVFIGAVIIYFLARSPKFFQPDVALAALVLAGVCFGFLIFNFHPAKIFLGEGGGLFLGLILGVLAVIAGGKIATALLVMAVPIMDLVRVIYLRLKFKQPIFQGDRRHLHFQLLDMGLGHRQAVLILYLLSFSFGITTLFLQSNEKIAALLFLALLMVALGMWLGREEGAAKK